MASGATQTHRVLQGAVNWIGFGSWLTHSCKKSFYLPHYFFVWLLKTEGDRDVGEANKASVC